MTNLTKLLNFEYDWGVQAVPIPDHTQETLERYLVYGLRPGGFVSAMLAMDMQAALNSADQWNREAMHSIGFWIMHYAPPGSWGSYEQIETWCRDPHQQRWRFKHELEKQYVWRSLKEKNHA